jgi:hypothetical protein
MCTMTLHILKFPVSVERLRPFTDANCLCDPGSSRCIVITHIDDAHQNDWRPIQTSQGSRPRLLEKRAQGEVQLRKMSGRSNEISWRCRLPKWVKIGRTRPEQMLPGYTQKRTSLDTVGMSQRCRDATSKRRPLEKKSRPEASAHDGVSLPQRERSRERALMALLPKMSVPRAGTAIMFNSHLVVSRQGAAVWLSCYPSFATLV